jgi:hypothetical protein
MWWLVKVATFFYIFLSEATGCSLASFPVNPHYKGTAFFIKFQIFFGV